MKRVLSVVVALGFWSITVLAEEAKTPTLADILKTAYQNEINANAEYAAFAAKADEEGYKAVSALFKAAAKSEEIHLAKHAAALKDLNEAVPAAEAAKPEPKTTKENLEKMIQDKTTLKDTTHPAAIKQAEAEKKEKAALSFKGAMAANGEYIKYAQEAVKDLDTWKAGKEFFVCLVCSYVMTDPNVEKCPICAAPRAKFVSFK